jgi:hypothetical protein
MSRRRDLERRVDELVASDPDRARELRRAIAENDPLDERARRLVAFVVAASREAEGDATANSETA